MAGKSKRIVVTGGAGFLGSHLCDRLLAQGHTVFCVDNFFTGSEANLAQHKNEKRLEVIRHDVCDPLQVNSIDEIFNLACPASPVHYQHDPVHTMKTSVLGALNLLALAKANNAKIFQASTSEVYGDPTVHPQTEAYRGNVNPIGPRACYDEGKRAAETLFFDYARRHKLNIRVVRIFNTYGPRMHPEDGRVVSNFIVQALQHKALTVYGDGQQTRSFCYADDLVDGFLKLMDAPDSVQGPINMGNPGEFTIDQLADLVIKKTSSKGGKSVHPLPEDDPMQRKPDITLAQKHLNWSPKVALAEGLDHTIAYFRQRLAIH